MRRRPAEVGWIFGLLVSFDMDDCFPNAVQRPQSEGSSPDVVDIPSGPDC